MNNQQPPLQTDTDAQPETSARAGAQLRPGAGVAHPPTDARRARKRQERQLLAIVVGVLVIVGGALIALVYGPGALFTALPCLLASAGAILILYLLFLLAERWVNR